MLGLDYYVSRQSPPLRPVIRRAALFKSCREETNGLKSVDVDLKRSLPEMSKVVDKNMS